MAQVTRRVVISQDDLARNLMDRFVLGGEAQNGMLPSTRLLAEEYGVSRLFCEKS